MIEFFVKKGDTWPPVRLKCWRRDFTGATVVFFMRDSTGALAINGAAGSVVIAIAGGPSDDTKYGVIEYKFIPGQTDTVGDYKGELRVTYVGGAVETFPDEDDIVIHVKENVA